MVLDPVGVKVIDFTIEILDINWIVFIFVLHTTTNVLFLGTNDC